MFRSLTHASGFLPSQAANCPAHWQPLYFTHSSLPGAGYDSYQVFRAVFQVNPGESQLAAEGLPPADEVSPVRPPGVALLQASAKPKSNRGVTRRAPEEYVLELMTWLVDEAKGKEPPEQFTFFERAPKTCPHSRLATVGLADTAVS